MKLLTKNLWLKILALLAAILLWFFVVGFENTVYRFPQEIDIRRETAQSGACGLHEEDASHLERHGPGWASVEPFSRR